ncbi:site-specific integrase [Streptomyces sp. NPDC051907]|uniref:site-specific integrase n=1 Tax=Streptomyces sp. NPDC051907 TaxID=3155284 RepID=UPI0034137527
MTSAAPVAQPLSAAIDEYLEWATVHAFKPGSGTPRTYRIKLNMYAKRFGHQTPVREITGQDWYKTCGHYWAQSAAETYNSGRRAAISFLKFCRDCEPPLTTAEPPRLWTPRPVPTDRSRALPQSTVATFFNPDRYPLRERTLWSVLYDSSERLSATLKLNVPDLERGQCFAPLRVKGGDTRYIVWTPPTDELLWEYIGNRTCGPVWLGEVQPWNWRERPEEDKGPDNLYRLTAHRARIVYKELTGIARPHRIRHSRLTHVGGRDGTSSAMLRAISGHLTDKMVSRYSQPGPEEVAAFMVQVGSLMSR